MAVPEDDANTAQQESSNASNRPKRVRTGCLTCRERHLKCDEGLPHCQNCKKSNRTCKRGLRLNFIDTNVKQPPHIPHTTEWNVSIVDESREIASEYQGGLARYGAQERDTAPQRLPMAAQQHIDPSIQFDYPPNAPPAPALAYQELPSIHGMLPDSSYTEDQTHHQQMKFDPSQEHYQSNMHAATESPFSVHSQGRQHSQAVYGQQQQDEVDPSTERRDFLSTQDEVLFMQGTATWH